MFADKNGSGNGFTETGQGEVLAHIYRDVFGARIPGGSEDVSHTKGRGRREANLTLHITYLVPLLTLLCLGHVGSRRPTIGQELPESHQAVGEEWSRQREAVDDVA